jgi:hypothetical protein
MSYYILPSFILGHTLHGMNLSLSCISCATWICIQLLMVPTPSKVIVGTLKLGYPLLLYKDEEPMWLSLSHEEEVLRVGPGHSSPQSQAAILGP